MEFIKFIQSLFLNIISILTLNKSHNNFLLKFYIIY
jgi:hypothetical protein